MQTEDPLKVTAGRSKPVSSSANTPGSRVHLGVWAMLYFCLPGQSTKCFLCFGFSRAPPTVLHSASFCLWFLSHQMLSKYLHNWQFGLFIFPLPLHPLLVFSSFQADIYSYLCDKSHASTMTADDYGKMGGVEVSRWEDSGGLWTASCWGKIQK